MTEFQKQVDKAIEEQEKNKQSPREVYEANERVIKQVERGMAISSAIKCLGWAGWVLLILVVFNYHLC